MATRLSPKGSKPASVYWVRRAIVLIPVLLVVGVLIWLITTLSDSAKTELPTVPDNAITANPADCNPANVDLEVTALSSIKADAEETTITVTATNTATQVCVIAVTKENTAMTIVSGKDQIWSTQDCPDAIKPTNARVDPNSKTDWSIDWSLRRSSAGCKLAKAELKPGTYQVKATWGDSSTQKAFQIVK